MTEKKILILSYKNTDILSLKLYEILKKNFSILITQNITLDSVFYNPSLNDKEDVFIFLEYHNINLVCFTSELIDYLISLNKEAYLFQIIDYCDQKNKRILYVHINNEVSIQENTISLKFNFFVHQNIYSYILNKNRNNCCIVVSTVYGKNDLFPQKTVFENLLEVVKRRSIRIINNKIKLIPLLIDEIALKISVLLKNNELFGVILFTSDISLSLYDWIVKISEENDLKVGIIEVRENQADNHVENNIYPFINNDRRVISFTDFSDVTKGMRIIKEQEGCCFKIIYKMSPTDYFNNRVIANFRIKLGQCLATYIDKSLINRIDYVVPVPETGIYYAIGLAESLKKPYMQALSKQNNAMRSFQIQSTDVRKRIVWNKIHPIRELLENKIVAIVDEAIFTGTTLKIVCELLHQCKVKEIHLVIPTPPCMRQCPYYVLPERAMLLEYVRLDMLCEYFNVASITFQRFEQFKTIVEQYSCSCYKCFEPYQEKGENGDE